MNNRNKHFRPESVEEQINDFAQIRPQPESIDAPEAHLLKDLRDVYSSYTQSGERVWERLARHITDETDVAYSTHLDEATAHEGNNPFANGQAHTWQRSYQGRSQQMKRTNSPTNSSRQATPSRLALIAAVLVAALLVSSLLWVLHSTRPGQIGKQPSVSHGIYLFKKDGIDKLDLQTHKVLWHLAHIYHGFAPMTPVFPPQAEVLGDNLYLLDKANTIVAINAQNGKMRWSRTFAPFPMTMGGSLLQPTLSGGLLYVNLYVGANGRPLMNQQKVLYGLDPANGAIKATLKLPGFARLDYSSFDENVLYYMNSYGDHSGTTAEVYAVQLPGGQPLWHTSTSMKNAYIVDGPYIHNDVMYITFHLYQYHDWIYAFDLHTGKSLRKYSIPSTGDGLRGLYFLGDMIYCPATDNHVYALDARTGKVVWKQPFDADITQTTSNVLYLHTNMNMHRAYVYTDLVALRAKDGAILWHFNSSVPGLHFGAGYTILNVGGVLYDLVTDDNGGINPHAALYAVRASDGTLLWQLPVPGQEVLVV
ncbi:MAG TPA: PQQ-binding-like beta-propeller repeat protein [Ktedonobacteraceae bacterium]|nr:PQQ-binding-like beta-propeller repeat protein [Ktedonobacteraceae bacterium]